MATTNSNATVDQSNGLATKSNGLEQNPLAFRTLEQIVGIWAERHRKESARPGAATLDRLNGLGIKNATDPSSFGPFIFDAEDARDVALDMNEKEVLWARASVFKLAQLDSAQLAALRVADPEAFSKYDDDIDDLISYASALKAFAEEISTRKAAVIR